MDSGWAGKQLIDAVVYMGYLREAEEDKDDWTYTEQVAKLLVDGMPTLSDVGIKRLVDGYYDSTPDGHPFLGAGVRARRLLSSGWVQRPRLYASSGGR